MKRKKETILGVWYDYQIKEDTIFYKTLKKIRELRKTWKKKKLKKKNMK